MKNPKLLFEKYNDPLVDFINKSKKEEDDELFDKDDSFDDDKVRREFPFLQGPQGILPLFHGNLASANFNMWVVHTNFRLDEDVKNFINLIEGIETFELISPYRWRISIARLFNEENTKRIIEDKVITYIKARYLEKEFNISNDKITSLKKDLEKTSKFWSILIKKDKYEVISGDNFDEVISKYNKLQNNYDYTIKSWD